MTERLNVNLPFCGFYYSTLSQELDHVEEREAEWFTEDRQEEENIPEALRLDAGEVSEILFDVTDYRAAQEELAEAYTEAFADMLDELLEFDTGLKHETMTSPRYYNFETDRIFAWLPVDTVKRMFAMSEAEGHETLRKVIRERHTSYDGYISHYDNELSAWLEKPVTDWDHNELASLLVAVIELSGGNEGGEGFAREVEWSLIEDGEAFYHAHSNAVDWKAFDERVNELREEKAEAMREDNPEWVPPYRCPETMDLFDNRGRLRAL